MACGPLRRPRHAFACACVLALGLAWSDDALAADDERGRPWARGTWLLGGGPGLGFAPGVTQLSLEIGGRYFLVNGFAVGLTLNDTILFYSRDLKNDHPGIQKRIPTNVFRIVPQLQYVFFRNRWFSPYILGGVGPAFMNHGSGTHGYWRASPGAYIGLGKSGLFLDIGMQFDGMFPVSRCDRAITDDASGYRPPDVPYQPGGLCSFGWGPRIGLVGAFGGRGESRRSKRAAPPPSNPLPREVESPPEPPVEPPVETPVEPTPEPPPTIDDAPPSEPPPPGSVPSEPPPPTTAPPPGSESGPPTDPSAPERPIPPPF